MLHRFLARSPLSLNHFKNVRFYGSQEAREFIEKTIKDNDVVVFMKGTARAPMCGFSRTVCKILEYQGLPTFASVNVLDDEDIRQEIKSFTSWPTIPQVFVKGNFVGGCDIMLDMNKTGQLRELLVNEKLIQEETDTKPKDS